MLNTYASGMVVA